ncbi:FliG C-terminal domain-containing protein [Paludisphaera borealis]|uniref:Flagellar motor switch protein FliG n=1 Tax=Paludisphaera borealis TaxID=1387353 RepID=A0A1U7CT80_9BACT|nr:FliG C-terminal domain-containing protein [Paludisphaera borealis]APW62118.1 Flagellar motor switch protein FliG [Paludisphaera borealis]
MNQTTPPRTRHTAETSHAEERSTDDDRDAGASPASISPLRKAAIVLVSLEQSLSSQLLTHLDREAVEAVTWEIARMDRVDPDEQAVVLEEFLGMGLRRLCFVFDDLLRMDDREVRAGFHADDSEAWALALAGAAAPVRAKVLGALNASASQALQRHLENLGPFRLSDTEVAQAEITERFRGLYDQGTLDLPDPSGREEVLV